MEEQWKNISFIDKGILYDYTKIYQVSNTGKIRSLNRQIFIKQYKRKNNTQTLSHCRNISGKNIKIAIHRGYATVYLYNKDNVCKCHLVHRIVAKMFIENPKKLPCINHKDGNKLNNNVDNLEWCTYSDNLKHAYRTGLKNSTFIQLKKLHKFNEKPVLQYDLNGVFIHKYESKKELEKNGYNKKYINRVCRGERNSYRGFIWKYECL